jgi:hypothetical protein
VQAFPTDDGVFPSFHETATDQHRDGDPWRFHSGALSVPLQVTVMRSVFLPRPSIVMSVSLLLALAGDAKAQGFINPFVGTTLTSPSAAGGHSKAGFGVAGGKIGTVVGLEAEFAYYPEVLDNAADALAKNRVLTFSSNVLVGPTIGRLKAYGALGAGDLHLNFTTLSALVKPSPESISSDYFAVNLGGGVMGFFNAHLGLRGDLRYYRAFGINLDDLEADGLSVNHFNFWRAGIGLVAKF